MHAHLHLRGALKNVKRLVDSENLPWGSREAASCVFDHVRDFVETGDGWLA
jgi:hypothetical protein